MSTDTKERGSIARNPNRAVELRTMMPVITKNSVTFRIGRLSFISGVGGGDTEGEGAYPKVLICPKIQAQKFRHLCFLLSDQ